jgi:hypothetical protein
MIHVHLNFREYSYFKPTLTGGGCIVGQATSGYSSDKCMLGLQKSLLAQRDVVGLEMVLRGKFFPLYGKGNFISIGG